MRILLPPSEAKSPGGRGRPLSARDPHPVLGAPRERALAALATLLQQPREVASGALLLPPAVSAAALADNAAVRDARTAPALDRYAGTVYDGLAHAAPSPAARRVLDRCVLVFSGLFGVVRGDEPIPPYRVPGKAVLPGLGVAATFWRPVLDGALPGLFGRSPGLIVDLRSSDYSAMWRPRAELVDRVVTVRVLSPLPKGGWGVVSAASKFAKGRLSAALAERVASGRSVETVEDIASAWTASGGLRAEAGSPRELVVFTETARIV